MELKNYIKYFINIIFFIVILLFPKSNTLASWQSQKEVISSKWGYRPGQFYYGRGDTSDSYPTNFGIDNVDNIIINDNRNLRIQKFNSKGNLIEVINKPKEIAEENEWPHKVYVHSSGSFIATFPRRKKAFYDNKSNLIKINVIKGDPVPFNDWYYFLWTEIPVYTINGKYLKAIKRDSLEIGKVERKKIVKKNRVIIKYPDITYTINGGPLYFDKYRGCYNSLYIHEGDVIRKYDKNGELISKIVAPKKNIITTFPGAPGMEAQYKLVEEYGDLVLAPNGDVYTWKRTPDKYSIIKWTWYDGEDSPSELQAIAEKRGIRLTWKQPKKNAKSVKKYEILRSEELCGPFNPVATVHKSEFKFTDKDTEKGNIYFYQVRGVKTKGYTSNSNKVGVRNEVQKIKAEYIETDSYKEVEKKILSGILINTADLNSFGGFQLKLLRNTVFARYGREFKSEMISIWFKEKSWYKVNKKYSDHMLKADDKKNVSTIYKAEKN